MRWSLSTSRTCATSAAAANTRAMQTRMKNVISRHMKRTRIALAIGWIGPFAILGWTALHVRQNWSRMPERYPTHWGFDGPDKWQTSTIENVDTTLALGAAICVFIALVAWLAYRTSSKAMPAHLVIPLGAAFTCAVAVA